MSKTNNKTKQSISFYYLKIFNGDSNILKGNNINLIINIGINKTNLNIAAISKHIRVIITFLPFCFYASEFPQKDSFPLSQ